MPMVEIRMAGKMEPKKKPRSNPERMTEFAVTRSLESTVLVITREEAGQTIPCEKPRRMKKSMKTGREGLSDKPRKPNAALARPIFVKPRGVSLTKNLAMANLARRARRKYTAKRPLTLSSLKLKVCLP